jgi:charged multivesicular body protein 2A
MKQSIQKARAVVRQRRMLNKFSQMKAHLQGISMRIQSVKTMEGLQKAVSSAARMMQSFNRLSGGAELSNSLKELERQNSFMTIQSEMVDEELDSVFEEDNDEDAPEDLVMQVMSEAGVDLPNASESTLSLEERFERIKNPLARI